MLSLPPAMGRARGEGGQVPGFSSVARTGCSREITQSTVIHCVDTEVYVALIYPVIFFTLPSLLSLARSPLPLPRPAGTSVAGADCARGHRSCPRVGVTAIQAGSWWGPDGVARPASVKPSKSHESPDALPTGSWGVKNRLATQATFLFIPDAKGHVLPTGHMVGEGRAGSRPSHPVHPTTVFVCPLSGGCPAGIPDLTGFRAQSGVGVSGGELRLWPLCSSLDSLQVCACTCGRA